MAIIYATHQSSISHFIIFNAILVLLCFSSSCMSFKPTRFNSSARAVRWYHAGATWYGEPNGAGSSGGSCGYGDRVSKPPFSSMVTGIGPSLYKSGLECGACYQVKCSKHPSCSGKPVRVVITDFCPGGVCASEPAHFDLSGTAFGAMAKPGHQYRLRDAGILQIQFARVACHYSNQNILFRVDMGSNPNYFAVVIEFQGGDGDLARVRLQQASSKPGEWWEMNHSWGAVWQLSPGSTLHAPFSIKLTSRYSGQTLVAKNVIPKGWQPGATYRSLVNYL